MAKFVYSIAKNACISYMSFELNCSYHFCVSFEKDSNFCFQSKKTKALFSKLKELMTVCQENLYYTQKLLKQAYNKGVMSKNYIPDDKIWLNSKYIKIK